MPPLSESTSQRTPEALPQQAPCDPLCDTCGAKEDSSAASATLGWTRHAAPLLEDALASAFGVLLHGLNLGGRERLVRPLALGPREAMAPMVHQALPSAARGHGPGRLASSLAWRLLASGSAFVTLALSLVLALSTALKRNFGWLWVRGSGSNPFEGLRPDLWHP